ncbi:hypothetical protein ABZ721_24020 [Streptomyces sp. NPDC006733]|uniref:hypothetical protein n=1 Tax=Streptomyces sp. NPDC006733 TaxID=3155460 RepID=UPI00340F3DC9
MQLSRVIGIRLRRVLAVLVTIACAGLVSVAGTATSHAALADIVCTTSGTTTYNPGLTYTPQTSAITTQTAFAPCVSLSAPLVTSGARSANFSRPDQSCLTLLESGTGTNTITWNTGQTTTAQFTVTSTVAGGIRTTTQTGTVTAGLFTGDTFLNVVTAPTTDLLNCVLPGGLTSTSGTGLLTIT